MTIISCKPVAHDRSSVASRVSVFVERALKVRKIGAT